MHTVTKSWRDLPAAHRQPKHDGHCRLIHGHNWGFDVVFGCDKLDENGFVVDVGKLKDFKDWLESQFDHTLLINQSDPKLDLFTQMHDRFEAKVVIVPNCGMEGLAYHVFINFVTMIEDSSPHRKRGLGVLEVTCWEDSKNRATYLP